MICFFKTVNNVSSNLIQSQQREFTLVLEMSHKTYRNLLGSMESGRMMDEELRK